MIKIRGEYLTLEKLDALVRHDTDKVIKKKPPVFSLKKIFPTGEIEKLRACKAKKLQSALNKSSRDIYLNPNPYRWGGVKIYCATDLLFKEPTLKEEVLKYLSIAGEYILDNLPAILLGLTIALITWRIVT